LWSQWQTGGVALPLSPVYDVHSVTPWTSGVHITQNITWYRRIRKREKGEHWSKKVKDKRHIRNIENGDFPIQRISCKNNITQEWYHMRAVCMPVHYSRWKSRHYFGIVFIHSLFNTAKLLLMNTPLRWSRYHTEHYQVSPSKFCWFWPLLDDYRVILDVNTYSRSLTYKSHSTKWTSVESVIYRRDDIVHSIGWPYDL
jgi:hypothetical protein